MDITYLKPSGKRMERAVGAGFLEVYSSPLGELPVVHVAGTREEMGRQYGALVGDMIRRNADRLVGLFAELGMPDEVVRLLLDKCWKRLESHAPECYLREMAAIAEGAREAGFNVTIEDIHRVITVTNFDLYKREERALEFLDDDAAPLLEHEHEHEHEHEILKEQRGMACTMFAVWGSRTVDGKMFADRDLDWVSQTGIHKDRLIAVYHPAGKHAFVTMGYAGVVGGLAGMNEKGISLGQVGAFSVREELDGIPWVLMARQVLEESDCLEDAVAIIQDARHTIGYNYLVADGDPEHFGTDAFKPNAAAFETNFECCETFYEDDPQEREASWTGPEGEVVCYGMPLKEAVLRADTAFGKRTRALQATDNGPGEPENDGNLFAPFPHNTYLECHKPMHDMIRAYETGAEYVFPLRGTKVIDAGASRKIGPVEALTIAGTVAHNVEKLDENDWDVMSVVYAPTDLEFWVAYESCDAEGNWKNAPDSGYWRFDLVELLAARADM